MKIAIDSDMLRDLVFFSRLTKEGVVFKYKNPLKIDNNTVRLFYDDFAYLYDSIKSYRVELHISKYVYNEVKHDENVVEFIKKYCHRNFEVDEEKIEILAQAYSNHYIVGDKKLLPPMNRNYVAAVDKYVPTNDCYIMADATVNFCSLLTNNVHDFIFDKSSSDKQNHRRSEGIKIINQRFGYSKKGKNDDFIPQPLVIKKLVKYLRNLHERDINATDNLVKKSYIKIHSSQTIPNSKPNCNLDIQPTSQIEEHNDNTPTD